MNWQCDVYVYENFQGSWVTHVAGRRRLFGAVPTFPLKWLPTFGGKWNFVTLQIDYPSKGSRLKANVVSWFYSFWHNRVHMASLSFIPLRPIGLSRDGETILDGTAIDCAASLISQ